jgi:maltose O-acetyltransferase
MYNPEPRYYNVKKQPIIGENVSLVNTLLDCNDQITIGDNVAFGHDCMVLTGLHEMYKKGAERFSGAPTKPVVIGDGVWIASGVIICPGVVIGNNAVIGAGSVVTRDVKYDCFYAGVPAKFIKQL